MAVLKKRYILKKSHEILGMEGRIINEKYYDLLTDKYKLLFENMNSKKIVVHTEGEAIFQAIFDEDELEDIEVDFDDEDYDEEDNEG